MTVKTSDLPVIGGFITASGAGLCCVGTLIIVR